MVGFYVYFVVRLGQIRVEMRENIASLSPEEFEIFHLTLEEYKNVRVNDHEVRINGQMYDHSSPNIENDMVTLYAKHDEAEDHLFALLHKIVDTHANDHKSAPQQLMLFLSLVFEKPSCLQIQSASAHNKKYYHQSEPLLDRETPVPAQPPRA